MYGKCSTFFIRALVVLFIIPHEARQRAQPLSVDAMVRSVKLFLIRHGETVDNVAGF
jgi:hypothetical protein